MAEKCFDDRTKDEVKRTEGLERFPMEIGPQFEGQRIRRPEMYVEFGGPQAEHKFELFLAASMDEVEDGKVEVVGPDISEMKPEGTYSIGIIAKVAGAKVEKDLEGVLERRHHYYMNYIEGVMHLNQRSDIWIRVSKAVYKKGLTSLRWVGLALLKLFKSSLPIIERMQITYYTDPVKVAELEQMALKVYEARDARARGLMDEDVDTFYACVLCQSFAPAHVCIITPNRLGGCGSISWFDARASYNVDPKGPNFPVEKGALLDPVLGIYEGVNKIVKERSLGVVNQVALYTLFKTPHTSCGCFEAIAWYIPEVDGIGVVHRDFKGPAVMGLPFSTLAGHVSGGTQNEGFLGIAVEFLRSPKFLQADGGWERVVWLPSALKERVKSAIPEKMVNAIATEKDVKDVAELKQFLEKTGHPVVERWKTMERPAPEEGEAKPLPEAAQIPVTTGELQVPVAAGGVGFRIVLQNVRITAERAIIKRLERE
ncbi:MAG: CO dehydrogenase/CO-methylating acetyl-CoA synthase complex subunit beta [Candidatus Bathyarchaeia archaeon]